MSSNAHTFGLPIALANTAGVQPLIEKGSDAPDGTLARPIGSLFLRTDTAELWQNTNGATAWTLLATLEVAPKIWWSNSTCSKAASGSACTPSQGLPPRRSLRRQT